MEARQCEHGDQQFQRRPADVGDEVSEIPREHMDYLGDGVYALFDGYGIWLHANSHDDPTDRVYLEPEVLAALNGFAKRMSK